MRLSRQLGERLKPSLPTSSSPPKTQISIVLDVERIIEIDLSAEHDRDLILERASLVSEAPARMPFIGYFGRYNKRWYVDIVSLPHNSVRKFLTEFFATLNAFHKFALDVTAADIQRLFLFIREFTEYTKVILGSEENILYPEVDSVLKKSKYGPDHVLSPVKRLHRKESIYELLEKLTSAHLSQTPSVTLAWSLQKILDELSKSILGYYTDKEAVLPRIFAKSIRGSKEKNRMEDKLINYFSEMHREYHFTALLTIPLTREEVRSDFIDRHFYKGHRNHYQNAVTNISNSIFAIPRAFEKAAEKYETRFSMNIFLKHYGKNRDTNAQTKMV